MADSWDDFTANPILTIKSGTCPKAVADSTDRLCQCAQDQLEHLEARARTLATCGHFEEALKDAYTMTRVVRSSPLGYLCVGHVYALQGRQKAAIGIYEQGLDAVPSTDPSRQRLVEARSMAQERDSTRIDFIKELPIDIIENIAPWILCPQEQIPPSEIREYLDVSRVWRERLLMSIRELHIESTPDDDLADDDDLLEQIAPICTALTLQDTTDGFPRLMPKTLFPSLKALNDAEEPLSNETTPEICTNALASVGSTLRYLTINAWEYGICLGDILSSCPNLVYLEARKMDADLANGPECHPNLKILLSWDWNIEAVDIDDITKRLPGLEVFAANPIEYTKDLKTIQDNCPYVKVLGINDHETSYFYLPSTITRTTSKHDDDRVGGVHTLYIDRFDTTTFYSNIREVMDFMRRNNHTLQHVYFYYPLGGRGGKNASILNHAIQAADGGGGAPYFKSMTTFTNCICDYDDILLTRWIVRESPHLKELELMRYAAYSAGPADTSALFDDLIGRCELESVVFDLKADPAMDMGGVERFIQYHGTFDSPLHTLTLPKHTRLSKDALEVLTRLPQLEKLNISWPLMKEEDQEDENCSHLIGKLKRLQHLEIWSDEVIPDDVFLQLSKLNVTSLKLHMPIFKSSKQLALLSLLQCPKLEELDVSDSSHEDDVSVSSYEDDPQIDEIRNMLGSKIETVNFS
ncbi:hypothetical protein O0I10_012776 [Lichtheimia ornata]|uniref:F-box domain-containing protein n=1 Tax=Lichtheimia ornata TaxID=688661 RepID=A0AAD7US11_9FUNG|nr:uncharacterized protein O0I10_012776 [Lichtheimia ornata]KAJ8651659.1 hypothetical protein O0I10_012776 [Lichtheimia ornata]